MCCKSDVFNCSTSVSGGQLNDDDHRFHLSELYLKKYACALKCTARVVAGNLIKDNKAK